MTKKLYTSYDDAAIPGTPIPAFNSADFKSKSRKIKNLVLARWPNGRPCHLVNMWLLQLCMETNAKDTLKTYAAQITWLIRYCFTHKISFSDFSETHFADFKEVLVSEMKATKTGVAPARNNNQTAQIQHRTLELFYWLTTRHPELLTRKIVGAPNEGANITVEISTNPYSGTAILKHPEIVSSAPYNNDKSAIDEDAIQKIQDEISRKSDIANLPPRSTLKLKNNEQLFRSSTKYIYDRRMFLVRMAKLLGMRPEELYDLPLDKNQNTSKTLYIELPTKKRRVFPPPVRRVPIDPPDARRFQHYLDERQAYIDFLQFQNIYCADPTKVFIGENGVCLKKESLTKEFQRLCQGAGLESERTCLSMFRHRFVTRHICIKLLDRFERDRTLMNGSPRALKESVCLEVTEMLGHADPASIFHYYDSEYKALTTDSEYNIRRRQYQEFEAFKEDLTDLEHQSKLQKKDLSEKISAVRNLIADLSKDIFGFS